ncbi:aldo/keto reductase [Phytohabitans flavus]|uniref:Oxidoreductase n=1 Tax=Phytohabitans flavus TaxID=1076124 RepID=A0A6F8XNC5_9ACTN|nr:aldo/keto reductase [Phytohabitans flavus]BCB75268.1 oxidoreductase [Phytohabitans flavus]
MTAASAQLNADDSARRPAQLVLGTMTFGAQVDQSTAAEMIALAADAGLTMVDTANVYADGASEEIVGRLLAAHPGRFTLATKVGMPSRDTPAGAAPLSAAAVRACVEASLRRLGTDRIDLLYLHQPDRATPVEQTLSAVAALVAEGKVGELGVSNYAAWQIADLHRVAAAGGLPAPTVSQPLYNLVSRRIEEEYLEFSRAYGLTNVVYNPLAGGLLTGKHDFARPAEDGRFGTGSAMGGMYRDRYWSPRLFAAVEELAAAASAHGLSLVELAMRWLVGRDGVGGVILGSSRTEHLRANLAAAAGGPLPDELSQACDRVWQDLRGPVPSYNR